MREIKFRAWAMVGGKQRMYEMPDLFLIDGVYWINLKDEPLTRQLIEIDGTETILEQYTGIKDKNGNEIYEGDIVNLIPGKDHGQIYAVERVINEYHNGWYLHGGQLELSECREGLLIIGNIHQKHTILEN